MKRKKLQSIFGETFILALSVSAVFLLTCLRFLLIFVVWSIKGFYQRSIGNEVDFPNIMSSQISSLKINILKKMRHSFVDEGTMITTILISSCPWKIILPFCLRKETPKTAFLRLTVNYFKIAQKNKL